MHRAIRECAALSNKNKKEEPSLLFFLVLQLFLEEPNAFALT